MAKIIESIVTKNRCYTVGQQLTMEAIRTSYTTVQATAYINAHFGAGNRLCLLSTRQRAYPLATP